MRWLIAILCLFSSACVANQPYRSADPSTVSADPTEMIADYKLGTSDKVRVTVFNEETLSGEYVVGTDGNIAFPLIGEIPARGRTASELGSALQMALADGFLNNPNVSVETVAFRPIYVLGEVNRAGEFPYTAGLTVLNAVSAAQGFTYRAQKNYVFITRAGSGEELRVEVTPSLRVFPGDTIRVAERYF